jgi:hypothetical protein
MSLPPLVFFSLTPEEDEDYYSEEYEQDVCTWLEDSECQENLFHILPLTPEETRIDHNNQIHTTFKLFFEELGYLTEEPESIDPTRDYEAEAKELLAKRDCKKVRQKHIELSVSPSLDESFNSGISSCSSSIYQDNTQHYLDIRSPYYIGNQHHSNNIMMKETSTYHYRSTRFQQNY